MFFVKVFFVMAEGPEKGNIFRHQRPHHSGPSCESPRESTRVAAHACGSPSFGEHPRWFAVFSQVRRRCCPRLRSDKVPAFRIGLADPRRVVLTPALRMPVAKRQSPIASRTTGRE